MDLKATDHVTARVNKLTIKKDYVGNQQLQIGNSECLKISQIGFVVLPSFNSKRCLQLKNILCVPKITRNLLSISKFTKDYNFSAEFLSDFCFVKDKVSMVVLFQGIFKDGLY